MSPALAPVPGVEALDAVARNRRLACALSAKASVIRRLSHFDHLRDTLD